MTDEIKAYEAGADGAMIPDVVMSDRVMSGKVIPDKVISEKVVSATAMSDVLAADNVTAERVLTRDVIGIASFMQNPGAALQQAEAGAVAVFADDAPLFYALTPGRLAQLLALERRVSVVPCVSSLPRQPSQVPAVPVVSLAVPAGKFAMFADWRPDAEFQRMAALWGIHLLSPVSASELLAFVSYWQAEGKMYHHIQWQQKLARSVQISRNGRGRHDMAGRSLPDEQIPDGFQG